MTFSERLFELLELKGISQYKFAKELGVSTSRVSQWKSRKSNPPTNLLYQISQLLGVSMEYLLTGEESNAKSQEDTKVLTLFHSMNDEGKEKALEQLEFFASKYKKHNKAKVV